MSICEQDICASLWTHTRHTQLPLPPAVFPIIFSKTWPIYGLSHTYPDTLHSQIMIALIITFRIDVAWHSDICSVFSGFIYANACVRVHGWPIDSGDSLRCLTWAKKTKKKRTWTNVRFQFSVFTPCATAHQTWKFFESKIKTETKREERIKWLQKIPARAFNSNWLYAGLSDESLYIYWIANVEQQFVSYSPEVPWCRCTKFLECLRVSSIRPCVVYISSSTTLFAITSTSSTMRNYFT